MGFKESACQSMFILKLSLCAGYSPPWSYKDTICAQICKEKEFSLFWILQHWREWLLSEQVKKRLVAWVMSPILPKLSTADYTNFSNWLWTCSSQKLFITGVNWSCNARETKITFISHGQKMLTVCLLEWEKRANRQFSRESLTLHDRQGWFVLLQPLFFWASQ